MENRTGHLQNCQRSDKDRAEQPIISPSLRWAVSLILAIHLGKDRQISPLHTHTEQTTVLRGHTYTSEQTVMHGQEHMPMWTCTQSGVIHSHKHTLTHIFTHWLGPGQNRVNPCVAGGGSPVQMTYIKESRASRGGLMMTKQGWWMLAGTLNWTWVGLHTGEDTAYGTCQD